MKNLITYVSNCMRFVSSAPSPSSDLCVGLGRAVDGAGVSSSGFGCIKMNGNSATKSLRKKKLNKATNRTKFKMMV